MSSYTFAAAGKPAMPGIAVLARRQPSGRGGGSGRGLRGVGLHLAAAGPDPIGPLAAGRSVWLGLVAPAGVVPPGRLGSADAWHVLVAAGERRLPGVLLAALPAQPGGTPACGDVRRRRPDQTRWHRRLARAGGRRRPAYHCRTHRGRAWQRALLRGLRAAPRPTAVARGGRRPRLDPAYRAAARLGGGRRDRKST